MSGAGESPAETSAEVDSAAALLGLEDESAEEPTIDVADDSALSAAAMADRAAVTAQDSMPTEPWAAPESDEAEVMSDGDFNVETLVLTLEEVTAERDSHLADLQRITADFANFRKQATKRQSETITSAGASVAEKLLPVLDACEAAIAQGSEDVPPIFSSLMDILSKEGMEHLNPTDQPFDPEQHEAVMHEPGEGEAMVVEVLRTGYLWNGKVIRPAMVKVQG